MSEISDRAGARAVTGGVASRRACRRMVPDTYRCTCGRVRDRCPRASVRALWSGEPVRRARPGRA